MPTQPIEQNQPFWQLAPMLIVSNGIPELLLGRELLLRHGAGTALLSILVGNLLLWVIGLAIIAMSAEGRKHSIENVKDYLGTVVGKIAAIVLLAAFVIWIGLHLQAMAATIGPAFREHLGSESTLPFRLTVAAGLVTALISCAGIRGVKWVCVYAMPVSATLIVFFLVFFWKDPQFAGTWGISLAATVTTVGINLPGFVNLPTIFRHSKSRTDSFFAISLIAVGTALWQLVSLWTGGLAAGANSLAIASPSLSITTMILAFSLVSVVCANLVNIYFASAGWETFLKSTWGAKEYAIVGLAGTVVFGLVQDYKWIYFLENTFTGFLACLGIVLLAAYVVRLIVQHRPRLQERALNSICWGIGCAAVLYANISRNSTVGELLVVGSIASALALMVVIFIEESVWSAEKIYRQYSSSRQG